MILNKGIPIGRGLQRGPNTISFELNEDDGQGLQSVYFYFKLCSLLELKVKVYTEYLYQLFGDPPKRTKEFLITIAAFGDKETLEKLKKIWDKLCTERNLTADALTEFCNSVWKAEILVKAEDSK